jgi:hypothetical protein
MMSFSVPVDATIMGRDLDRRADFLIRLGINT